MLPALLLTAFAFFATIVVQNPRGGTDKELQGFDFFSDLTLICIFSNFIVVQLVDDAYVAYSFPTSPAPSAPLGLPAPPAPEGDAVACTDLAIRGTTDLIVYVGAPPASVARLLPSPALPALPAPPKDDGVACTDLAIRGPTDLIVYVGTPKVLTPRPTPVASSLPSAVVSINPSGSIGDEPRPAVPPTLVYTPSDSTPLYTTDSDIVEASNGTIVEASNNTVLKELSGISLPLAVGLVSLGVVLGFVVARAYYSAECVAHPVSESTTHYLYRSPSPHSVSVFHSVVIILIGVPIIYILFDNKTLVMKLDAPLFLLAALLLMVGFSVLALFEDLRVSRILSKRKSLSGPASARFSELLLPGTTCGKGPGGNQAGPEFPEASVGTTDTPSLLLWVVYSVVSLLICVPFIYVLFDAMVLDVELGTPVFLMVAVFLALVLAY